MRAALFAVVLLPAVIAPAQADKCVPSLTYQNKGGDLDKLAIPEDVPDDIVQCASPICSGEADIKMVVEKDGSVGDVVVTMTVANGMPSNERAELLRQWMASLKFEPPTLDAKPVCVNLEFDFTFAQKKSKHTP